MNAALALLQARFQIDFVELDDPARLRGFFGMAMRPVVTQRAEQREVGQLMTAAL